MQILIKPVHLSGLVTHLEVKFQHAVMLHANWVTEQMNQEKN